MSKVMTINIAGIINIYQMKDYGIFHDESHKNIFLRFKYDHNITVYVVTRNMSSSFFFSNSERDASELLQPFNI